MKINKIIEEVNKYNGENTVLSIYHRDDLSPRGDRDDYLNVSVWEAGTNHIVAEEIPFTYSVQEKILTEAVTDFQIVRHGCNSNIDYYFGVDNHGVGEFDALGRLFSMGYGNTEFPELFYEGKTFIETQLNGPHLAYWVEYSAIGMCERGVVWTERGSRVQSRRKRLEGLVFHVKYIAGDSSPNSHVIGITPIATDNLPWEAMWTSHINGGSQANPKKENFVKRILADTAIENINLGKLATFIRV